MDRKEKIFAYINSNEYVPLKFQEMMIVLDVPERDEDELKKILHELCMEGKVVETKKGRYVSIEHEGQLLAGKLVCNSRGHFGFVISDEEDKEDVFVSGDDMGTALNGDRVLIRIDTGYEGGNHKQGKVIKILERSNRLIVGVVYKKKDGHVFVKADNRQIYAKFVIPIDKSMEAQVGDRVALEPKKYKDGHKVIGEVLSLLGSEESLKSCIEGIILENGIKQEFDSATLREAVKIPENVSQAQLDGREDLRDMLIFTIDGDDARDFDDAVSATYEKDGNYTLGVHIADVSEYVTDGSAIELEAYERGTSVYLADRVIPMLPEKLSNGICSLNPNVDRLTLSCFMEINPQGEVVEHRLVKTVINSKERMTYNNVNKMLEDNDEILCDRYKHLLPTLKIMEELALILRNKRIKRGSINFDFPETKVKVNEYGEPVSIEKDIRGVSNKMIEEFMLCANETVAEYAYWSELPFIYRNHEAPSLEKITSFNSFIMNFGLSFKGKIDKDNPIHPKALQNILDAVEGTPQERIVSMNMLHSLMKAKYSEENMGHFGLAAKYYCHFTSPIRRYPDLAIHRILKDFIDGKFEENSLLKSYVAAASIQSSECEVNAEHTERDVDDLMKTAYMRNFVGDSFDGVVANVMSFGMFVELENSVEGLIRAENMTDDYYIYEESTASLVGKRKGKIYKTGDKVRVVLARADIMLRQIDFVLEKDADKKLLKSFKEKKNGHNHDKKKKKKQLKYKGKKKHG